MISKPHLFHLAQGTAKIRRSMLVILLIAVGLSGTACDQFNKKKDSPKEPKKDTPASDSNGNAGNDPPKPNGREDTPKGPRDDEEGDENDVSLKLSSGERKQLKNFACENKSNSSKIAKLSKMAGNSRNDQTLESLAQKYDEDKIEALKKFLFLIKGDQVKAKASLASICSSAKSSGSDNGKEEEEVDERS